MPFVLILIAAVLLVTGIRGTYQQLGSLLLSEFQGQNNFGIWLFAFFVVGAVGYIPSFKKLSDAFLLLIIIVIIISNDKNGQGFFTGLQAAMNGQGSFTTTQEGLSTVTNLGASNILPQSESTLGTLSPLPPLVQE